jgi:betaine-aldehyde dehydrogenase
VLTNFINGTRVAPVDGGYTSLIDPCTGEAFESAPVSGAKDVDNAMHAAAAAFEQWRETTPSQRQQALLKIADAVESRVDDFLDVECRNTGKPRDLTASEEMPPAIDQIRFFAGAARLLEGRSAASTWPA